MQPCKVVGVPGISAGFVGAAESPAAGMNVLPALLLPSKRKAPSALPRQSVPAQGQSKPQSPGKVFQLKDSTDADAHGDDGNTDRGLAKLLGPLAGKLVKYPFLNLLLLVEGMERNSTCPPCYI